MSVSRPESKSHEHLLDWAVHELAAQWDGTTNKIAMVIATGAEPLPSVYWMARSEAADHTLHLANDPGHVAQEHKPRFQQVATQMINPAMAGHLNVLVCTRQGLSYGDLDPQGLAEINQQGVSSEAVAARKKLVSVVGRQMYECVTAAKDRGVDPTSEVFIIADPEDPRASTVAHIINQVVSKMTNMEDAFGDEPVVVLSPIPKAKSIFDTLRPKISAWLDRPAPVGTNRIVCMAHGGELLGAANLSFTVPPAR